jgi:hypothetical protein
VALFTPSIARLRALPVAALLLGFSLSAQAQTPISITSGTPYSENFDGMGTTTATYPAGWAGIRYAGTGAANGALTPAVLTSTSNSGTVYSAGPLTGTATDRAIGTLASGSTAPAFGAAFVNNTGATVTTLTMAAREEQWRIGGSTPAVTENVVFEYSLDATNLNSGTTATWVAVPSMDLPELAVTSNTAGPLDGNATGNFKAITGVLTNLNWPVGTTLWIRWRDTDDSGSDGLYAVDDFTMTTGSTTLSSQNKALQNALGVFPNPATNRLTLRMGKEGVGAAVEIFNALGQRVQQAKATQEELTLDVSALRAGVYTVRFTTNGGTATRSFLKQ